MSQTEPAGVSQRAEACTAHDQWFALRLRSQYEFKVQGHLQALGVEEFSPTWDERVKWSDREKVTTRPLFPGYIFAKFGAAWPEVLRLPGVVQILPTSLCPIPISDAEIANLKLVLASQVPVLPCAYVAGDTVLIDSGALAGVSGVVVRTKGSTRLVVSVPMLMSAVNVELEASTVAKT